jgi:hypothetical protein
MTSTYANGMKKAMPQVKTAAASRPCLLLGERGAERRERARPES